MGVADRQREEAKADGEHDDVQHLDCSFAEFRAPTDTGSRQPVLVGSCAG
jgi:hypothetical protein